MGAAEASRERETREGTRNGAAGRALAAGKPVEATEPRAWSLAGPGPAEGLPSPAPRARSPGDAACGLGAPARWSARAAAAESATGRSWGRARGANYPEGTRTSGDPPPRRVPSGWRGARTRTPVP